MRLVDLRKHPFRSITDSGIDTVDESFEFDAIVFATGFDAMTGALVAVDITGHDGVTLKDKWAHGPATYLGLTTVGFPNLFFITGPGSPSVLSNMAVSIEQHVDWVADCLADLRARGVDTIEPTETAEAGWVQHVNDCADITLYPTANSWYMGANVPGKPRVFLPYIGGVGKYRIACDEVVERDYLGFRLSTGADASCNDGVIRRVQPDVAMVIEMMAMLGLPPLETMDPVTARAFMEASSAMRPPGPDVGEIVDGKFPGPAGDLSYRLYRPPTDGPHPIVVYFHGGGWVLGNATSDDPLCRDLCVRSNSVIVSVDYRHSPEARFPAAIDDGFAATRWVADNAVALGGIPGELAVFGWSAGGNIAAVVCQLARDAGGPESSVRVCCTPVTDLEMSSGSYAENGEGYILTAALMKWFCDHYVDEADRSDHRCVAATCRRSLRPATGNRDHVRIRPVPRRRRRLRRGARCSRGSCATHRSARPHAHRHSRWSTSCLSGAKVRGRDRQRAQRVLRGIDSRALTIQGSTVTAARRAGASRRWGWARTRGGTGRAGPRGRSRVAPLGRSRSARRRHAWCR